MGVSCHFPRGVHFTQKVHAPFEQRVVSRTLNAGILNPLRVVTFTPFPFSHAYFSRMGGFRDMGCTKRVNISEKRQFRGNFWEVIEKNPKRGDAGIPGPKF